MRIALSLLCILLLNSISGTAQSSASDTVINNLVHPKGYITCEYGSVPQYKKVGMGKKVLILVPGLGFDASVFDDFMQSNSDNYTMYAITLPGIGDTKAQPMPDTSVSYGELSWNKGVMQGLVKLIEKEKLNKPVLAGHFVTGTQIVFRMAIDYPEKVGGVIILGGPAKMMAIMQDKLVNQSVKDMIRGTDSYWGPQWFKTMKKDFYDNGNFIAEIYSGNEKLAASLWKQVITVPMPVAVRYSCEYFASDIIAEADKIKCPVLILRAMFNDKLWANPMNKNWIQPQFVESWNFVKQKNPLIKIVDVNESAAFVWKDKPVEVNKEVKTFFSQLK